MIDTRRGHGGWAVAAVVAAPLLWWLVGFAPWIAGGLSQEFTGYPRTALPVLGSDVPRLVTSGAVGGVAALALLRPATRGRPAREAVLAVTAAVALVLPTVVLLSLHAGRRVAAVDPTSLPGDPRGRAGLLLVVLAGAAVGLLLGALIVLAPRPVAVVAGCAVVLLAVSWLGQLVTLDEPTAADQWQLELAADLRWVGGVGVGLLLGLLGWRTAGRLAAWVPGLALALVVPAALTASVSVAAGLRPGVMGPGVVVRQVEIGLEVFRAALLPVDGRGGPWFLAIAVAVVVAARQGLPLRREEHAGTSDPLPGRST